MNHGKDICEQLKKVRKGIADENGIPLKIEECTFKGECRGTCPRCEAEMAYLEAALTEKLKLGKVATVAGLALGLAATQAQAQTPTPSKVDSVTNGQQVNDFLEGEINDESISVFVDDDPAFPGGKEAYQKFIDDNLKYPQLAAENGIGGTVVVAFVVDTDGTLVNPRIIREVGGGCGSEALRLVKMMPKWIPGKVKGKLVRTYFTVPVVFNSEKNRTPLLLEGMPPLETEEVIRPYNKWSPSVKMGGIEPSNPQEKDEAPGKHDYYQRPSETIIIIK